MGYGVLDIVDLLAVNISSQIDWLNY